MLGEHYTYSEYKKELIAAIEADDVQKKNELYNLDITWYRDVLEDLHRANKSVSAIGE